MIAWKSIFGFSWIKLIIPIIIILIAWQFRWFGVVIGGSQPIEAYIIPTIILLSIIYLILIILTGIVYKIKSKK